VKTKTLKELRTLARNRGVKGYSKLSRTTLEHRLALVGERKPDAGKVAPKTRKKKKPTLAKTKSAQPRVKSTRSGRAKKPTAAATRTRITTPGTPPAPTALWTADSRRLSSNEERVENAKYATVLPGGVAPSVAATDLGEDIDRLPPISEPMVCLLLQKPGVLHGYWVIPPGSALRSKSLKLRLERNVGDVSEAIEELHLPHEHGNWYFHFNEIEDIHAIYLQLGYYEPDGRFITVTRRGIARIPSLYASPEIDSLWSISDEKFRSMYLRAGGFARGARLGWAASNSSPGVGPSPGRLAWPGNVSSR
jgi:hypothetical protein